MIIGSFKQGINNLLRLQFCSVHIRKLHCSLFRQNQSRFRKSLQTPIVRLYSDTLISSKNASELDNILQASGYYESDPSYSRLSLPCAEHEVLVVQPKFKYGAKRCFNTTLELQLAEAVTLAETLPGWKIKHKIILQTENSSKKLVFGGGNLDKIREILEKNPSITAVFISLDMLSGLQHREIEKELGVSVYDRYTVVLNIFRDHARTKEAKLQIALAEIPYYRSRLYELHKAAGQREGAKGMTIGGSGETYYQKRKRLLQERELSLKKKLEDLREHRHILRQNRKRMDFPVVAVVGYTNAGKTSLIKALTEDLSLVPKNQLFATLDVTAHLGLLPSMQKVLYIDTVGFISNIPTALIESFASTLEDISLADVIVHIQDLSHPDLEAQKENVAETLSKMQLSDKLMSTIIQVGNKIDLASNSDFEENIFPVSCTRMTGVGKLLEKIEYQIFMNTGRKFTTYRVPNGGEEFRWLYKEASVTSTIADIADSNFLFVKAVVTPTIWAKFKHKFGNLEINNHICQVDSGVKE